MTGVQTCALPIFGFSYKNCASVLVHQIEVQDRYVILLYIHNCIFYSPTLVKLLYLEFSLSSEKNFTYPFDMQKYRQILSISSPNDLNLSEILTICACVTGWEKSVVFCTYPYLVATPLQVRTISE